MGGEPLAARHQLHRVDRGRGGVTTGISAADRAHTIRVAAAPHATPDDIVQPGHIFPLMAQPGGVLVRAGHTEACCDLARLAGHTPAAVLCEIMSDDGTMARLPDLEIFAADARPEDRHHRRPDPVPQPHRALVERIAERPLTTPRGRVPAGRLSRQASDATHLALARGPISPETETLVRVHEPLSVIDLLDADSDAHSWSVLEALQAIAAAGRGVIVLLHRAESRAGAAPPRDRRGGARAAQDGPAQLRHRRADPARSRRRQDAAARAAAQDAEHGGLRSRGHRLRRGAARARRIGIDNGIERRSADGAKRRVGIVLSRFNPAIGKGLLAGALRALNEAGVADDRITIVTVPGALETPLALQRSRRAAITTRWSRSVP